MLYLRKALNNLESLGQTFFKYFTPKRGGKELVESMRGGDVGASKLYIVKSGGRENLSHL